MTSAGLSWIPLHAQGISLSEIFKGSADLSPLELCIGGGGVSFYVSYNKEHIFVCPQVKIIIIIYKVPKLRSSRKHGWLSSMIS